MSVISILSVLGMVDERQLLFPDPKERYDFERDAVVFRGRDGEKTVRCAISEEALEDHFGGDAENQLKAFASNREGIEHEARRKYLSDRLEPDGTVLIRTGDL